MISKEYKYVQKEFEIMVEEARKTSVIATLFCALIGDENVHLSQKFYFALRDEIFKTTGRYHYEEDKTRIITIRDERNYTNLQIELIQKTYYKEELYFVRSIKSNYLQYNANMKDKGIGKILRIESEKSKPIYE